MTMLLKFLIKTFARTMPRTFIATVILGLIGIWGWLGAAHERPEGSHTS